MELSARITEAIEKSGKSPADIAREMRISASAITQWMDGTTKSLRAASATKLEAVTGYSATWLVEEKGPRIAGNVTAGPDPKREVPLISWVQAGQWLEAQNPFQPEDAERWMPCIAAHSPSSYALRVRGESMTAAHGRTYPPGCIIFVDPERCMPINGDRVVARMVASGEVTFKVFKDEDGQRWLQPLNPNHLPMREEFSVLGTVIGKWEDE